MKGSKLERSPGVWRLRVYIGNNPATGRPIQVSRTFRGTETEADTALSTFLVDVNRGEVALGPATTLARYLDRWLDHITPTRSPATIRGYRFKVKRISDRLGRTRLDKLTAQDLDRAYRAWLDEGLDPSSVHHLHRVMSAALHQGVTWGVVPYAMTDRATPPPRRSRPAAIPTLHVVQRLIAAADQRGQPVLAASIAIAATTGLRRGELAGLRWDDVDLDHHRLHVRRSVRSGIQGGWVVGPTRTRQTRGVALDPFTVAVLREHRARSEAATGDAGVAIDPSAYVLTFDPSGTAPMSPNSLGQAFRRLCRLEGIAGVTLHSLRHFSAGMLIASGRDVRTVAGRLGHADASTTLRLYADTVDGRDQDAADYLGRLLTTTGRPAPVPHDPNRIAPLVRASSRAAAPGPSA
jgi:integrase